MAYSSLTHFPEVQSTGPDLTEQHDTLFFQPEAALDLLEPAQRTAVSSWLDRSQDREKDIRYLAVGGYLADTYGEPDPTPERREVLKSTYARDYFGAPSGAVVADDDFFGMVKDQRTAGRQERRLLNGPIKSPDFITPDQNVSLSPEMAAAYSEGGKHINTPLLPAAQRAALEGKSVYAALAEWHLEAKGRPGYRDNPEALALYERKARAVHSAMKERVASVMPVVGDIMQGLERERDTPGQFGGDALVQKLLALPAADRQLAIALIASKEQAAQTGTENQEARAQFWKSFARGGAQMLTGTARTWSMDDLDDTEQALNGLKPGDEIGGRFEKHGDKPGQAIMRMEGSSGRPLEADALLFLTEPLNKNHVVTQEDIDGARAEIARKREAIALGIQLEQIGTGILDPIKSKTVWQKVVNGFAGSVAPQLAMFAATRKIAPVGAAAPKALQLMEGGGSMVVMHGMMADQNAQQLMQQNPGMDIGQAYGIGRQAAVLQTGMEYAQNLLGMGLLGKGKALGQQLLSMQGAAWKTFGKSAALGVVGQNAIEGVQDITPQVVQGISSALSKDYPKVKWDEVFNGKLQADGTRDSSGYWSQRADTFWAVLPLAIFGAGGKALRDSAGAEYLNNVAGSMTDTLLNVAGVPAEARPAILAETDPVKRLDAFSAAPKDEATAKEGAARFQTEQREAQEALTSSMEAAGVTLETTRAPDGAPVYRVTRAAATEGGEALTTDHGSMGDAMTAVHDHLGGHFMQSNEAAAAEFRGELEALVKHHEAKGEDVKVSLTNELQRVEQSAGGVSGYKVKAGQVSELELSPQRIATLDGQLKAAGITEGVIRGANWITEDAGRILRHYELNRGADASTVLHERVESMLKSGAATQNDIWEAANQLSALPQFEPSRIKDKGMRRLAESLRRIALEDPSVTADERRETLVELVVASEFAKFKDGQALAPGSLREAVRLAEAGATGKARAALKAFAVWLKAVRSYFGALFGTTKAIREALDSGALKPGEAWEAFADKLLGTSEQKAHDAAVAEEAGVSFSLGTFREEALEPSYSGRIFDDASEAKDSAEAQSGTEPGGGSVSSGGGEVRSADQKQDAPPGAGRRLKDVRAKARARLDMAQHNRRVAGDWVAARREEMLAPLDGQQLDGAVALWAEETVDALETALRDGLATKEMMTAIRPGMDYRESMFPFNLREDTLERTGYEGDDGQWMPAHPAQRLAQAVGDRMRRILAPLVEDMGFTRREEPQAHLGMSHGREESAVTFSLGSVTPAQDAEYMAAVESGDVAKAQAMVDKAAKAAGYEHQGLFHGSSARFDRFMPEFRGSAAGGVSANEAFFLTDSERTARGYAVHAAEDGPVKRIMRDADIAEKRGDWDEQEKLIMQAEAMVYGEDGAKASAERRKNAVVYRLVVRGKFLEVDAKGQSAEEFGSLTATIQKARRQKLDGVIFRNLDDAPNLNDPATHFAIFSPNAIKSADPITYDADGKPIPLSQRFNPASDSISYSLGSVNALESLATRIEEQRGGAKAKLEIYADMARTISGMARAARSNEDVERVLGLGEIERKRIAMNKRLAEKYVGEAEDAFYARHTNILSNANLAEIFDSSLMDFLFRKKEAGKPFRRSRILSRTAAERKGMDVGGDYDGARDLPHWLFAADGMAPDKIVKELAETGEFGMGEDASPDDLWNAIGQALDTATKYSKELRAVEGQMIEARDDARSRAATEAREWANAERWRMAESDKRDAKRALVALDAMLMHLPAEVRGRVGGFTKLSELTTNKAREKYFLDRVAKIDAALESYLRKSYIVAIRETLAKGRARKLPGEKDRGKLGVNAHTWLETAEAAMGMSTIQLEEREAWVDSRLFPADDKDRLTPEAIADLNRAWDFGAGEDAARLALEQEKAILELFGGLTHREAGSTGRETGGYIADSAQLESALEAAREQLQTGRQTWDRMLMDRRDRRAGRRAGVQLDSGNDGGQRAIAEREEQAKGMGGAVTRFFQMGASFEQFVGDGFGRESDTHRYAEDTVLGARLTAEGLWQQAHRDFQQFISSLWPRTGRAGLMKRLEALSTPRAVPGLPDSYAKLSEMQALHYTMLWADDGSRAWLRRHGMGDGEPAEVGGDKGVDAQAALEAFLSPEAQKIREWLQERYDAQYDTLNAVYRRIHGVNMPRVRNYAPRMVMHGKDAVAMDPLNPGGMSARGVFSGFTKRRRPDISAAPVAVDALQAFMQNQRVVSHFVGWAEASSDLRAVFSTSQTAPFIRGALGKQGAGLLNQWITDLEQAGAREAVALAFYDRFMRALADNALMGKLSVLAKQASAAYGAAVEIGWTDYFRSARRLAQGKAAATVAEVAALPIMRQRATNRSGLIGQAASGTGASPWTSRLRAIGVPTAQIDLGLELVRNSIGATDAMFTTRSAAIAYDAYWLDGKAQGMNDAAAHDYAKAETTRTISRTAQPDNVADKSLFENHASKAGRILFAFQSMNRAMLFSTFAAFRDGGIKSGRAWRLAVTHWIVTGLVTQTIGNAMRDLFSDDDEEDDWKLGDYGRSMLLGPLTGAIFLGPIVDVASTMLGGFERRTAPSPAAAMTDVTKELMEAVREGGVDAKDTEKLARGVGMAGQTFGGGWWSGINILANMTKQVAGFADNLQTTPEEATSADAKKQRAKEKEARDAREAALTDDQRATLKRERERRKAEAESSDAAQWRAGQ